jgi:hypothetical protein
MSLAQVVLEIAEELELECKTCETNEAISLLTMYAKQLRRAVKASEGAEQIKATSQIEAMAASIIPTPRQVLASTARADRDVAQKRAVAEEGMGVRMCVCVGGASEGDMVPFDPNAPIGVRSVIGRQVYQLKEDGKMHFDESATSKMFNK